MAFVNEVYQQVFLVSLGIVQSLDALSTSLALSKPGTYEANRVIAFLIGHSGSVPVWAVVFIYEIFMFIAVWLLLEALMIHEATHLVADVFVAFGFIMLVVWRMIFIVVPNFALYFIK